MAASATRGRNKKTLLPNAMQVGLKQGANKLIGLCLLACAGLAWTSLISWSISDPSLNRATSGSIQNLLGKPGAVFSDILFQSFGLASIIFILPVAILGLRFLLNLSIPKLPTRILSWPVSTTILAITLSILPTAKSWALPQSYGGIVGDTISKLISLDILTSGSWIHSLAAFLVLLILSIYTLSFTTAIRPADAQILLAINNPDEFKQLLKSPLNRISYWLRAYNARPRENAETNQRHWWRNANWEENKPQTEPQNGPEIHNPMPRPNRPDDFIHTGQPNNQHLQNGNQYQATAQDGTFSQMNPMSARPNYDNAHPYEFEPLDPGLGNAVPHSDEDPLQNAGANPLSARNNNRAGEFILPPIELLNQGQPQLASQLSADDLREMAQMLEDVLLDFGVKGSILNVRPGPVITLFEFEPARGIKTSRIVSLADDIARSMSALSARIAVIPGRNALGIELPNITSETVYLRELVETTEFYHTEHPLPLILGKSIGGEPVVTDLSAMPHLLIAGTTGSGKSVGINTMLLSLLYKLTPAECRMIMIDPKMLELSIYDGIPHLLTPVVTDPHKALSALKWAVREMEDRYRQMSKINVRNIESFNQRVKAANQRGEPISRTVQTGFDQQTGRAIFEEEQLQFEPLPMIVVVIDEMADLMMVAGKEIEMAVQRLAQMARAAGIHVIMATQRPSVDVITGTIKANFPTRISFQVTSKIDSRTILGKEGAEQLLGRGDMLFMPGGTRMTRIHGAYVDDIEVERVVEHLRAQGIPEYLDNIIVENDLASEQTDLKTSGKADIYNEAVAIVIRDQKASTSYLQRRLSIGYNRAATLMERLEEEGIVSPANHANKRDVLVDELPFSH